MSRFSELDFDQLIDSIDELVDWQMTASPAALAERDGRAFAPTPAPPVYRRTVERIEFSLNRTHELRLPGTARLDTSGQQVRLIPSVRLVRFRVSTEYDAAYNLRVEMLVSVDGMLVSVDGSPEFVDRDSALRGPVVMRKAIGDGRALVAELDGACPERVRCFLEVTR